MTRSRAHPGNWWSTRCRCWQAQDTAWCAVAVHPDARGRRLHADGLSRCRFGRRGPLIHADRSPRGYLGGLPGGEDVPPTVTLSPDQSARALVEGLAVDSEGNPCPTYTDLLVTAPDTTDTVTVPVAIDACRLQVHPVTTA